MAGLKKRAENKESPYSKHGGSLYVFALVVVMCLSGCGCDIINHVSVCCLVQQVNFLLPPPDSRNWLLDLNWDLDSNAPDKEQAIATNTHCPPTEPSSLYHNPSSLLAQGALIPAQAGTFPNLPHRASIHLRSYVRTEKIRCSSR